MADVIDAEAHSSLVSRFLSKEEYAKQGKVYTRLSTYELIRNEDKSMLSEHPFYLRNMYIRNTVNFIVSLIPFTVACVCAFYGAHFPTFNELLGTFPKGFFLFDIILEILIVVLLRLAFDQISMKLKYDYYNSNKPRPATFVLLYAFEFLVYYKVLFYYLSVSFLKVYTMKNLPWLCAVFSLLQDLITNTKESALIGTVICVPVLLCCSAFSSFVAFFGILSACKYAKIGTD